MKNYEVLWEEIPRNILLTLSSLVGGELDATWRERYCILDVEMSFPVGDGLRDENWLSGSVYLHK